MSCNEWKEYTISDACEVSTGFAFKSKEYLNNGVYRVVRGDNVKTGFIQWEEKARYWNDMTEKLSKYILKENDIVVGMDGSRVGKNRAIIKENDLPAILAQRVACIRANDKFYQPYIKYVVMSNEFERYVDSIKTGTSIPHISMKQINEFKFKAPSIEEQEKIANILSSLDDKIELNNDMNNALEEMAKSIFKRWFVDFEFPNEDGQPYKSSGGEMVDSELGMIPNGWEVKSIYELAEYINGTSFKSKDYSDVGLPIIKIAELKNGITDSTKFFYGEKDQKFYLKNRDILFSWSGNPDTSIDTFIWDKGDAILNQHIFKVIPKFDNGYAFTYLMLKYLKSTFTHIARNKQTTGLGHVTVKDLKELKIALCFDKIKEFNKIVEPIVDLIFENNINTKLLNETRDSLLPKLMSGEIRVN